ncbi:MAG: response regulator [Candidatus Bathyarchaeia archaeon]|jgi:DNA-binding NtrC family response regulator
MDELSVGNSGAGRPSVLIVDDEAGIRKLLTAALNENGFTSDSAENGAEAIKKANERYYNLALIDIMLPDINGVELLAKFKPTRPRTRKIIMTGNPSLQNAVEALNKGADAYILKPLDIMKVLTTLEEQLNKQKEQKDTMLKLLETGRIRARIELIGRDATETPNVR